MTEKKKAGRPKKDSYPAFNIDVSKEDTMNLILQYLSSSHIDMEIESMIPGLFYNKKNALSAIYNAFLPQTNIPISLPVFGFFAIISAYLLKNNVKWSIPDMVRPKECDLWIFNLAPSGSSKTFSFGAIENSIPNESWIDEKGEEQFIKPVDMDFGMVSGPKAWLQEMEKHNKGFWHVDEAAQFLKQVENMNSPQHEIKKYLMLTYDHQKIERINSKESFSIKNPALSMIWLNTPQSFFDSLSFESLSDGFAQRFCYVITDRDLDRPYKEHPIYDEKKIISIIEEPIQRLFKTTLHQEYIIPKNVEMQYRKAFKDIVEQRFNDNFEESFYRRVMFKAFTYAVIFHLIFNKESNEIDEEDMEYALKVCLVHLYSIQRILTIKGNNQYKEIKRMFDRALIIYHQFKAKGLELKSRDLQQKIHGIKSSKEANFLMEMILKTVKNQPNKNNSEDPFQIPELKTTTF